MSIDNRTDVAAQAPVQGLAALLDHDRPPWRVGEVPPLGHWLYFLPAASQREMGIDGHPRRTDDFAKEFPRRMWAGGRIVFHAPIVLGSEMIRHTRTLASKRKSGRSGEMVFVTLEHRIRSGDTLCIVEEQDIVYRAAATTTAALAPTPTDTVETSSSARVLTPTEVMLFRYSALTFNAHRIHYDLPFARDVEGYLGLVVHGPLIATLLLDAWVRANPGNMPARFSFRAERPAFANQPLALICEGSTLTAYSGGGVAMRAEASA